MASVDELWLVDFGERFPGEPSRHRPALVLGPLGTFGTDFPFIIVCPLTTTRRALCLHVEVEATDGNGLDATNYVQTELLRSIDRRGLVHRLGAVDAVTSDRVAEIVKTLLGH
jgi:mRNA-degrading endonuclease toxin of MazEF toxin-antitoxin module